MCTWQNIIPNITNMYLHGPRSFGEQLRKIPNYSNQRGVSNYGPD